MMQRILPPLSIGRRRLAVSRWDILAGLLALGLLVFFVVTGSKLSQPLVEMQSAPLSLDAWHLPGYAARTSLRMLVALGLSLLFTFTFATLAAKNRLAGMVLIPILDVLQSVPILGFISVTALFFMSIAPGRVLGVEFAAIFAIFTSQAWNMTFSFYQSLRTVPTELIEASRNFQLSGWARFWRLEVPFAMPTLIWNMMMSMSGGWFFVVASEAIAVGNTNIRLPGVGSYIALAIDQRNLPAIGWAIGTMLVVILIYDQVLFKPLVAWADRFRFDQQPSINPPKSWVLTALRRSHLIDWLSQPFALALRWSFRLRLTRSKAAATSQRYEGGRHALADRLFYALIAVVGLAVFMWALPWLISRIGFHDIWYTVLLGFATMCRVFILIALASVIWVPIGVWVGLRPEFARLVQPVAQFLAAFPANLLFPIAVSVIVALQLNPDIWLSPLMILGTQWYILFNVIAGAAAIPDEMRDAGINFQVRGWLWWRKIALPAVFPFYVTGAITASGGSWNAAIVAELVNWGDTKLQARGLGAYIAEATSTGDMHHVILGIAVMSIFVLLINRIFWRPLYWYAERKFRLTT
ncbi:ABC transporter permease [Dongia soli]|uniref:ABC transporter permease subunit n=1 Tax=Dongia soli TaxID=600628 RepID=A0ABU5E9T5_9PROT|nr:ABC transporter permease subunit [Dongia soli]MDY0882911.1 ABC transporter permease subunit [Dongia soli]